MKLRFRTCAWLVAATVLSVAAVYGLSLLEDRVLDAAVALGTTAAAVATAAAAYFARQAAALSESAASTARLALSKHSPTDLRVELIQDQSGVWRWYSVVEAGMEAHNLELRWRVDGRSERAPRAVLHRMRDGHQDDHLWVVHAGVQATSVAPATAPDVDSVTISFDDVSGFRWVQSLELDGSVTLGNPSFHSLGGDYFQQPVSCAGIVRARKQPDDRR